MPQTCSGSVLTTLHSHMRLGQPAPGGEDPQAQRATSGGTTGTRTASPGAACTGPVRGLSCEIHEVGVPMTDGVQLAADLYMPAGCDKTRREPLPVLLEYIPYRKTEARGERYSLYTYFVERGFIVARVDIRGTGNSEGRVVPYEYSDIELDDGVVLIAWLAAQEWSNGNIGMIGISWGGFNSIQLAATRQPPELKAFVSCMATESLYAEDVHYIDGIIHTDSWMMSADLYNSLPGAPDYVLDGDWLVNRFEAKPSVYQYMNQQRDGEWWDRASSLDKYDRITVPGFHIGGWYDGYRNSLPRMLEKVKGAPVKALIGPWDHTFPHAAAPGPGMEWRHEAVRWFDHWLKGTETGIMDEPPLAVYVRDWHPPDPKIIDGTVPGKWRWEADGWPIKRTQYQTFYATPDHRLLRLTDGAHTSVETNAQDAASRHQLNYRASVGLEGGGPVMWWGTPGGNVQPMDDQSLVYDSDPLSSPLEILGFAKVNLRVASTATRANWVVRLCDIAPDGGVTQVVGGACNGTHRYLGTAREPHDLVPGEEFDLEVKMHWTSWVFPRGHRVRFAVTNAMWPMLWPTPHPMTTSLLVDGPNGAKLTLPVIPAVVAYGANASASALASRKKAFQSTSAPIFLEPVVSAQLPGHWGSLDSGNTSGYGEIHAIETDETTGESVGVATNGTARQYPWGVERFEEAIEHRTSDAKPSNTSVTGRYALTTELSGGRTIRLEQDVVFSSNAEEFRLRFDRRVKINGELTHEKRWDETFQRDFQ